jgi:hypothetical protein
MYNQQVNGFSALHKLPLLNDLSYLLVQCLILLLRQVSYDLNVGKKVGHGWMRTRTHKIIFESNRNQQGEMRTSSMIVSTENLRGLMNGWLYMYAETSMTIWENTQEQLFPFC